MPFINIGTGNDLILELPTRRTQNWNDNYLNNFATPITNHDHTGSGKGRLITTAGISANSVTGAKILLANDEYLRGRNNADSADVNIIKVNTSDKLATGADFANIAIINDTYLTGRNNADSAYINIIKVNTSDKLAIGVDLANFGIINDTYITGRNNADSAYINIIKVNTSDKLAIGTDLANLSIINNTYIQGRNNADSAYINALKINASDTIEFGVGSVHNGDMELKGANIIVSKNFSLLSGQTSTNVTGLTLTENAGKRYRLIYGIFIDATADLVEEGEITWTYNASWDQARRYRGDDSLVTFDVSSGQVRYSSSSYSGFSSGVLTYQLIEL